MENDRGEITHMGERTAYYVIVSNFRNTFYSKGHFTSFIFKQWSKTMVFNVVYEVH